MRPLPILKIGGLLLMAMIGRGQAAPPDQVVEPVGDARNAARFSFRVVPPAVTVQRAPDGTATVALQGFGKLASAPGAPELPHTVIRVAIPEGATPRLEVDPYTEDTVPGVIPRAVPRRVADVIPGDETVDGLARHVKLQDVREADPAIYRGRSVFPERPVWLGATGVLRDQRYVEVHVAPVRFDPATGALRVARSLGLTVVFDGASSVAGPVREDPAFEPVYRQSFANYAQGKTFRLGAASTPVAQASAPPPPAAPDATSAYRINVRQNGVVRLDYTRMSATGLISQPLSTWMLTSRGIEIPLRVFDANANDLMDPGDWVQFYGTNLTSEPKTRLNTDFPGNPGADIYEDRVFSDQNVYKLSSVAGARARMTPVDATPTMTRTPPNDFEGISHQETDDTWRPLGAADPWYWSPSLTSSSSPSTKTISVPLPNLASGSQPVRVLANLRGITEDSTLYPDHHSRITLADSSSNTLTFNDDNGTFDGRTLYLHDFTYTPGSAVTNPVNVTVEARAITSGLQTLITDYVEVHYRQLFQASGDALTFIYPNGDAEFIVSGLASSSPEIYEITSTLGGTTLVSPTRLTGGTVSGAGPFQVRFRVDNNPGLPAGATRKFVVAGSSGVTIPPDADFFLYPTTTLRDTTIHADWIVIGNPAVMDQTPGSPLNQLISLRNSQGLASKVVTIGDLENEFGYGLYGPDAIKNFLTWVMSTNPGEGWTPPKPAYVLILGDGSYDYKAGTANGTYVSTQIMFKDDPSFGYYASDNFLAAVVGTDQLADLTMGRIPARTVAVANNVLSKIVNYEQSAPAGNWHRHAVFVSDRGKAYDPVEANEFETLNSDSRAFMKIPPHTQRTMRYWSDPQYCNQTNPCPPGATNQMRADIKAAVNGTDGISDGTAMIQYVGHGNFDVWSDDAFFDNRSPVFDTDGLVNATKLPWLLVHTCLTGGFETTNARSMGKDWINKTGGGSMAVFGPSGLSSSDFGSVVVDSMWNDIYGPHKLRVMAVPVLDALSQLCATSSIEACQNYILMGDPATRLSLPTVQPPKSPSAVGGNVQVQLSWTASGTSGAVYDVYRSTNPALNGYTKINSTSLSTPGYTDTAVVNATKYYYYIVALDSNGFESAWSNFNSDCAVNGPDCVQATPLNPNPPAVPTGLVVTDPQTGGRLNLTWNANSETDLKNYNVNYRRDIDGTYTVLNVGKVTAYTLTGLENQRLYYVWISATNTSNKTSAYDPSQERTGTPTFVRGVRSPDFIATLHVDKSGSNALLSWQAVTTDIYGQPTTISYYEIFRGTTVTFVPDGTNKVGQVTGTSFTDTGALSFANPNYYWLVRAVDASGNPGGLGNQLPNGLDTMTMTKSGTTPGNVVLSWPAVTTDFDGNPIVMGSYEVYASGSPFTRANIRDGLIPKVGSTSGTSIELTPPAGTQYYSVIVVDARGNKSSF